MQFQPSRRKPGVDSALVFGDCNKTAIRAMIRRDTSSRERPGFHGTRTSKYVSRLQSVAMSLVGEHRENDQATDWAAGNVVAEILQIDLADSANRARIVKTLKTWVQQRHLEVYR